MMGPTFRWSALVAMAGLLLRFRRFQQSLVDEASAIKGQSRFL